MGTCELGTYCVGPIKDSSVAVVENPLLKFKQGSVVLGPLISFWNSVDP